MRSALGSVGRENASLLQKNGGCFALLGGAIRLRAAAGGCESSAMTTARGVGTGATGFIGRHLVPELVKAGCSVIAASRKGGFPKSSAVEAASLDIRDPRSFSALPGSTDWVIHAATVRPAGDLGHHPAQEMIETNVTGTLNVLQYA